MIGSIQSVANTIQTIEGWYPGSVSYRNNNPGNLTYVGQSGATQNGRFASFSNYDAGYQALQDQIALDASRGLTIQQFAAKYAPASDGNNPNSYAAQIAAAEGLSVNDPLSMALSGSQDVSSSIQGADTANGVVDSFLSETGFNVDPSYWPYIGLGVLALVVLAETVM